MAKKSSEYYQRLGVIILVGSAFLFMFGGSGDPWDQKNKLSCDVEITNPLLQDVSIEDYSCRYEGKCYLTTSFSVFDIIFDPLKPVKDKGTVAMTSGGQTDAEKFSLIETGKTTFGLTVCSSQMSGVLEVYNEQGARIDSQGFGV